MQASPVHSSTLGGASFPPLERETRAVVETDCAAYHLLRTAQTLRLWACKENGPIRPRRVHGRLMWPVAELRKLCGVEEVTRGA